MDDAVRDALVELCRTHGTEMLDDPAKLEAFLRDTCPGSKREIHCLVGAVRDGAVAALRTGAAELPLAAVVDRVAARLRDDLSMQDEAADWTAQSLVAALATDPPPSQDASVSQTFDQEYASGQAEAEVSSPEVAVTESSPSESAPVDPSPESTLLESEADGSQADRLHDQAAPTGQAAGGPPEAAGQDDLGGDLRPGVSAEVDMGARGTQSVSSTAVVGKSGPSDRRRLWIPLALAAAVIAVVIAVVLASGGDSSTTWVAQDVPGVAGAVDLNAVCFTDTRSGWAVGYRTSEDEVTHAAILATKNGGASWQHQDAGSVGASVLLRSVGFVDGKRGWAVGWKDTGSMESAGGVVLATRDGGTTWQAQDAHSPRGTYLQSVCFVDANRGWVVGYHVKGDELGNAVILATSDGGATWHEQDASAVGRADLAAASFIDSLHGWAVGARVVGTGDESGPLILSTSNGGASWQALNVPSAGRLVGLVDVRFVDRQHGWVLGQDVLGSGVILATHDGGVHWEIQDTPLLLPSLDSLDFLDVRHGWAVGDHILVTTDGGASWQVEDAPDLVSGTQGPLRSVDFVDRRHGWAVGSQQSGDGSSTCLILAEGQPW